MAGQTREWVLNSFFSVISVISVLEAVADSQRRSDNFT
jgi:hypothetical protein